MKKLITLFVTLCIFLVLVSLANATEMDEIGDDYVGNTMGYSVGSRGILAQLTIIGGFKCDEDISWWKQGNITTDEICWNNINGGSPGNNGIEHGGVEYQLFTTYQGKPDQMVDKVTILAGEKKCLNVPKVGDEYYRQAFYCDETQFKCEEIYPFYTAGCDFTKCNEGEVLRVRGLKDIVSGGCAELGWKTELCVNDDIFNFNCIKNPVIPPIPPIPPVVNGELGGRFSNVGIPPAVKPNEEFTVLATFEALETGTYYLEAGMHPEKGGLAITIPKGSKCDGSLNWAGKFFNLNKGEKVDLKFTPKALSEEGTYSVILGAYTGCLNEGGKEITTIIKNVKVTSGKVDDEGITVTDVLVVAGFAIGFGLIGSVIPILGTGIGVILGIVIGIIVAVMI